MKFKSSKKNGGVVMELTPKEARLPEAPTELTLKKILVPVDFSPGSLKAVDYATSFARQFGAEVMLMHVVESYAPLPEASPSDLAFITTRLREAAAAELVKLAGGVNLPVRPVTLMHVGNPHVEIVHTARETGTDLIILGTHGRTGLKHVLLGSIAENVVRHAPCPVLVVRENEREFINRKR